MGTLTVLGGISDSNTAAAGPGISIPPPRTASVRGSQWWMDPPPPPHFYEFKATHELSQYTCVAQNIYPGFPLVITYLPLIIANHLDY